jgi:hypothetical protein
MIKRIFSKDTFNGYHLVSLKGEGEDGPVGFYKKLDTKDTYGFMANLEDIPKCPNAGMVNIMCRPWGTFVYVPSLCQRCQWLYMTKNADEYDCLLKTKAKIKLSALVRGGE